MAIRSFTGYLNSQLFGSNAPFVGATFDFANTAELEILLEDGDTDLLIEGDTSGGNQNTENSEDPQGDQIAFIRDGGGTVLVDGSEFFLESTFVFEINGQQFTGYHFEEVGGVGLDFTILPPNLPSGTAQITSFDFTPTPDSVPYSALSSGDETINDAPYSNLDLTGSDTIIAGDGNDVINAESGADTISGGGGNDTINAGGGADVVDGGAGDDIINGQGGSDTIDGGTGDDTINAGGGNDVVTGNAGNDDISGGGGSDVIFGDNATQGLDYSDIPDPSGNGTTIDDGDNISGGVTLNSGGVQVDISFANDGNATDFDFNNSDTQNTADLNNGLGTSDDAILLGGEGLGDTSTTTISFSSADPSVQDEVTNVNFRINDIDDSGWRDIVTIRAFDADGNPIEVRLTGGANHTLSDTDGVPGNDTVIANDGSGNQQPSTAASSLLVEIDGPVATIEIDYGNLETDFQRVDLTEIFFQSIPSDTPGASNDTIDGGAGNDVIFGNQGDDTLDGGTGTDTVDGGTGDDEIRISAGADEISGGAGSDTFTAEDGSSLSGETINVIVDDNGDGTIEKINDGTTDTVTSVETFIADEAPEEADRITLTATDLTAADVSGLDDNATGVFTPYNGGAPISFGGPGEPALSELLGGTYVRPDGSSVPTAGDYSINGGDEDGQVGNISFQNFENIDFTIVCFAGGTLIRTDRGLCPVEDLQVGDLVETLDNGLQPIRWIGHKTMDSAVLAAKANLRPIRIKAGALAPDMPAHDLVVSPQHRILVKSKIAIRMFDAAEIFVPAKHLLDLDGVDVANDLQTVTYHHIMCDDHEIVVANGALAETLYTGTEAMKAMTEDALQEIAEVFGDAPFMNRPLARSTPKGKHVKQLVARHIKNGKDLFQVQV